MVIRFTKPFGLLTLDDWRRLGYQFNVRLRTTMILSQWLFGKIVPSLVMYHRKFPECFGTFYRRVAVR